MYRVLPCVLPCTRRLRATSPHPSIHPMPPIPLPPSPTHHTHHTQAMGRQNFGCDRGSWDFKGLQSPNVTLNGG